MVMERLAWFRRAVGATECVLVSSDAMRATLTGFGAAAAKIAVLPHQAPAVAVPAGSVRSPRRIGFFGTLREHKGAHVLVDAVRRIPSEILCEAIVRGKLAADPNYVSRLRRLAAGDARIRIVDEVPYAKFGEALGEVDIVVVPSIWPENAPLVLLSAIASGRYVVVSDQPGLTVAVAGPATGLIFPTGDAESLAAVLTKLIGNPAAVDPGRAGVDRSDHFASYVDGIEEQYRRAVTGRSQSKTHSLGGAM